MAKRNAIVRRLPSVETLGCTTVICSDKTGTLTTNEMCCTRLALPISGTQMRCHTVEGHTYAPIGTVEDLSIDWVRDKAICMLARVASICNESRLSVDLSGRCIRTGEPTEAALRVLVEKLGCPDTALCTRCLQKSRRTSRDAMAFSSYWSEDVAKLAVLEFSPTRKSMAVLGSDRSQSGNVLYVKGAPESILDRCSSIMLPDGRVEALGQAGRQAVQEQFLGLAGEALRTLALAVKQDLRPLGLHDYDGPAHSGHSQLSDPANFVRVETDLTFVGLVGIMDPPRPECKKAIEDCRVAGISVLMITGDNKVTAEAIAQKLGILKSADNLKQKSFTGK
ncbi:unnamed protein product, partial [Prorocentrum cordatum]